jgi:hypothetical protein
VVEKLAGWGTAAADYSEYRWKQEVGGLRDAIRGSTISMTRLPIAGQGISVVNGKAVYEFEENIAKDFDFDRVRTTDKYGITDRRENKRDGPGRLTSIVILLRDSSDRLAMEIGSRTEIDVVGRIASAELKMARGGWSDFERAVYLEVEISTWSLSR